MLDFLGLQSLEELTDIAVPAAIRFRGEFRLPQALGESAALAELKGLMAENTVAKNFIGMGYAGTHTPPVILRNILENPGWYTAYTPYQAEIAQGRLEALLNFQTMVTELTGMDIANASLLDEGTAAAEAMQLCFAKRKKESAMAIHVSAECHPQTIDVLRTRAEPHGIEVRVAETFTASDDFFAAVFQYPGTSGGIEDLSAPITAAHECGALAIVAADLLSLCLLRPPGEMGADVVVGSTQRFGVPMGYGGPHAAFFATKDEFKRLMPGRLIGVSKDSSGAPAYRLTLQTREQHIRRDRATSNICTAQVLLAVIAGMYAVYHGPEGLKQIAGRVHALTKALGNGLTQLGHKLRHDQFFDTLRVELTNQTADQLHAAAEEEGINLRYYEDGTIGISLDETTLAADVQALLDLFGEDIQPNKPTTEELAAKAPDAIPAELVRSGPLLTHPIFSLYHTETEMLRYLHRLESRDLSLNTSMIPLGSCTMKLNATTEMLPVTWPEVGQLHPFAPADQAPGYAQLFRQLEDWLADLTGFAGISLQPNAGSQGEYAGLLAIRRFHEANGQGHRKVCLIPLSAHGTNPASAVMAGMEVVAIKCTENGDIDLEDLAAKAEEHQDDLAAIMVTYPSTHGVFEQGIGEIVRLVHENGGQVYLDGANLNAQVGLCRPGDYGVDVCHLNLHKTFCIPHGGGGPGVGPIGVAQHLQPFLPGHTLIDNTAGKQGAVSAAPWGSSSILVITWLYIRMLGAEGLKKATQISILNANYVARQLAPHYPVLYKGEGDLVAHECIIDLRSWKEHGLEVEDAAKRLMDFGYHAPTMSWPVPGTLMIEPTESENKAELDRFCDAMIAIHGEMQAVAEGEMPKNDNPLKGAPHTAEAVTANEWERAYTREQAAYPAPWTRQFKFWPAVGRIDNVHGDRNLFCSCPPIEEMAGNGA